MLKAGLIFFISQF